MTELQVIARHTIRPGEEETVLAHLTRLVDAARQEPGNLAFDAYRSADDPLSYVLLERYTSRAAFEEHRASDHFQEILLAEIVPRLEARTIEAYDVPEGGAEYR
jgi:quinol monooxygenase YgiN